MRAQLEQPECGGTGRYSGTPSGLSTAATGAARRELASPSTQARHVALDAPRRQLRPARVARTSSSVDGGGVRYAAKHRAPVA